MEILPGIELKNKALWLKKEKVLVISDLHIGYEEALNDRGIFVPRTIFSKIKKEIIDLLKLKPKKVIILGDLKHEFNKISNQEWTDTFELIDLIIKQTKIVLIKGNHDNILGPIANKKNIDLMDFCYLEKEKIFFIHGNKIPLHKELYSSKIIIMGHEHPAIELVEGAKRETYKCFLLGKWHDKKIIVLPSFLPTLGTNILREKFLNPFLKQSSKDLEKFKIFITQNGKNYNFGSIKQLKKKFE